MSNGHISLNERLTKLRADLREGLRLHPHQDFTSFLLADEDVKLLLDALDERSPDETDDDEAHALIMQFEQMLEDTLVPNEPLEVYTSNSYRRVGLKSMYREVMGPVNDRDGHPNISNYAVLDTLVCAFNAMLARRSQKKAAETPLPHPKCVYCHEGFVTWGDCNVHERSCSKRNAQKTNGDMP